MGLLNFLRGGVPLLFIAGRREMCELMDYEEKTFLVNNKEVRRVRLFVTFTQKFRDKQTGFWFDPVQDFDPALPDKTSSNTIPWEDMGSHVIVCFKSFDGQSEWRTTALDAYQLKIKYLNEYISNLKRSCITLMRSLEKLKDPNLAKQDTFFLAEELGALDKLISRQPEFNNLGPIGDMGGDKKWLRE